MFTHSFSFRFMALRTQKVSVRRRPKQRRARVTVEAVLDAVVRILKRDGFSAITTNRIAEVAGVSIGSVYQYFPDKRAIFTALHQRHVDQIDRLVQSTLVENASSSIEGLMRAMKPRCELPRPLRSMRNLRMQQPVKLRIACVGVDHCLHHGAHEALDR